MWPLMAASMGAGMLGGIAGHKDAKRAYKRQNDLWQGALAGVDLSGSHGRQDVAESFGAQQAGLANRMNERNLTGSTAYDAALNANLGNRQRAMGRVNADTAQQRAAILGDAPTPPGSLMAGMMNGISGMAGQGAVMQHQGDMADKLTKTRLGGGGGNMDLWSWFQSMMGGGGR